MLRSLARPGLVWLRDDSGRSATALLVGLNETRATLRAGDETLAVQTAALAASTISNGKVEQCVVEAVRRWTFPSPEGGGIVVVTYPFVLEQTGG